MFLFVTDVLTPRAKNSERVLRSTMSCPVLVAELPSRPLGVSVKHWRSIADASPLEDGGMKRGRVTATSSSGFSRTSTAASSPLAREPVLSVRVNRRKTQETSCLSSQKAGDLYYRAVISPSGECWDMHTEYTECEHVGKGSYGEVVRAKSRSKGVVAIKKVEILEDDQSSDWENGLRLVREVFFLKNLRHPNLSSLIGLFSRNMRTVFIVTRYYDRGSLSEYTPVSLSDVLSIQLQVMEGLKYLHAHGVVHRDIKRENIFVDSSSGRVDMVIGDFGLSRSLVTSGMTSEVVTKPYRCPSLMLGETQYGCEIDVFAAGLVFMEMLTGKTNTTILPNRKMGLRNFLRYQVALTQPCEDFEMLSTRICDLADRMHVDLFDLIKSVREGSDFDDKLALEWGNQAWQLVEQRYSPAPCAVQLIKRMIDFNPCARPDVKAVIDSPVFDGVRRRPVRLSERPVSENFDRDIAALGSEEQKADAVKQAMRVLMAQIDESCKRI